MERTLICYDLVLEKKRQMNIFGESSLNNEIAKFMSKVDEEDYTYLNRPDSVIVEILTIDSNHMFGSYGRLESFDDRKMIRSRNKEDYSFAEIENLIETYTYFYMDIERKRILLLNNSKCTGFKTYFAKFLGETFNLNSYYDEIQIFIKKDENIQEKIFQANNLEELTVSYSADQLVDNKFINPKEFYELEENSVRSAKVTLSLEPTIKNNKLVENIGSFFNSSDESFEGVEGFKISTQKELIDIVEKIVTKKVIIHISEDEINDLTIIKDLLSESIATIN